MAAAVTQLPIGDTATVKRLLSLTKVALPDLKSVAGEADDARGFESATSLSPAHAAWFLVQLLMALHGQALYRLLRPSVQQCQIWLAHWQAVCLKDVVPVPVPVAAPVAVPVGLHAAVPTKMAGCWPVPPSQGCCSKAQFQRQQSHLLLQ